MRHLFLIAIVVILAACDNSSQKKADLLLKQANEQFGQREYAKALQSIDSLRRVYPNAIDTRKKALKLQQNIELKRAQEELALVDSALQAVNHDYSYQQQKVEKDRQELRATPEELTMLTRTRVHRDSLRTRHEVLCAKIRYIHKKQKEL